MTADTSENGTDKKCSPDNMLEVKKSDDEKVEVPAAFETKDQKLIPKIDEAVKESEKPVEAEKATETESKKRTIDQISNQDGAAD